MIGRGIMASVAIALATKIVVKIMTAKVMTGMITGTIMGIEKSPAMTIINMSIFIAINIMAIGIRGIHGNITKEITPIIRGMGVTKDIITNCFSCLMMV